jgi:hypothetical protein
MNRSVAPPAIVKTNSLPVSQHASRAAISAALGERIAAAAKEAVARDGRFTLAIAPALLDADVIDAARSAAADSKVWEHTHVFWADTDFGAHDDSPAHALALLRTLPIPRRGLHLDVADEPNAIRAACNYEQMMRGFFGTDMRGVPSFDLIVTTLASVLTFAQMRRATDCDRLAVAAFDAPRTRNTVMLAPPVIGGTRSLLLVAPAEQARTEAILLASCPKAMRECLTWTDQQIHDVAAGHPAGTPLPALVMTSGVTPCNQ